MNPTTPPAVTGGAVPKETKIPRKNVKKASAPSYGLSKLFTCMHQRHKGSNDLRSTRSTLAPADNTSNTSLVMSVVGINTIFEQSVENDLNPLHSGMTMGFDTLNNSLLTSNIPDDILQAVPNATEVIEAEFYILTPEITKPPVLCMFGVPATTPGAGDSTEAVTYSDISIICTQDTMLIPGNQRHWVKVGHWSRKNFSDSTLVPFYQRSGDTNSEVIVVCKAILVDPVTMVPRMVEKAEDQTSLEFAYRLKTVQVCNPKLSYKMSFYNEGVHNFWTDPPDDPKDTPAMGQPLRITRMK